MPLWVTDPSFAVPRAKSFQLHFCGDCPNGHLVLLNAEGLPICEAVIGAAQAENIAKHIRANDPNFKGASHVDS